MSTRRNFLKTLSGMALLTVVPRHVLGGPKHVAPSDQLTKGIIGVGGIGKSSYHFTSTKECRLVAVCDVDSKHLQSALDLGKKRFNETLQSYRDFRRLIADPNVDIVHIATPPHWHGIMAVEAAKAGKDIWCEKPMTRTIGEGKRVVEAVKRNNRIFRLNTWFRFTDTFYGLGTTVEPLKKLIDSGLLGWPLKVTISGTTGFTWKFFWVGKENLVPQRVPSNLDYDMWLGPAPYKPYNEHRVHQTFRGYWDYDGGGLTDMGQHYMDPVQYLLGKDETSPVKVEVDAPSSTPTPWVSGVRSSIPTMTAARSSSKAKASKAAATRLISKARWARSIKGSAARSPTSWRNWPRCPTLRRRTPTFWNASARGAGLRSTNRSVTAARRS